jgi:nucleotide-binding universal stress UspA family protein
MTTPGIARILVATDFSETSELALDYARAMAGRFGAWIHLLHVLDEPPSLPTLGSEMFAAEMAALCATRHERTRQRLQRILSADEGARFCATGEVRTGRAAETIRDVAVERDADLIVMGTHGRGGVAHLLLGSVAEKVVRIAPCAVLTVRPDIAGSATARRAALSYQAAPRLAESSQETL